MHPIVRSLSALLLLLSSGGAAFAQTEKPRLPKPRLIIAIAVDQFSGDLFNEYRIHFTGGLKRLSEGAVFPRGYQSHAATETCPGHSTILTGARPARTGIIANSWFDQSIARADKKVYCAEDVTAPGSSSKKYVVSPVHLRVPTLGGRMKMVDPATRVIAVSGKDRAAVMMGGTHADGTYWWSDTKFVSYQGKANAPVVETVNGTIADDLGQAKPALPLPAYCQPRDYPIALTGGNSVGTGRFARAANDTKGFKLSPELDAATLHLAGELVMGMKLGQQTQTDLLAISLSATDYIGHTYGTGGAEMCLQLAALDQALGAFLAWIDIQGIDYVVVLTADHGGHDAPERAQNIAIPDDVRIDPALSPEAMNNALARATGLPGTLLLGDGPFGDFWLSARLTKGQRAKVSKAALALWGAHPQVETVFTRAQLLGAPVPEGPPDRWSLLQEARASFDPARSGDFVVLLKPRVTPIPDAGHGYVATHGSPWDYDRRVPILFWAKGMKSFEQPNAVETVDIMPTLAALIGLPLSKGEIDGRCLDLVPGAETSCPAN